MTYLYLDIETVPTSDLVVIDEIGASIAPPKSLKKPETIAAWEADEKPALVVEAVGKTALSGLHGSICCIGWAVNDFDAGTSVGVDEREVMERFFSAVAPIASGRFPIIVGHNVSDFDLRFIRQRCIVLGIHYPAWLPTDPKPWDKTVFDTMFAWGGAKGFVGMDKLCRALGIEGKGDFLGADVAAAFERGELTRIAEYCAADIERTRKIHRKMMVASGEIAA